MGLTDAGVTHIAKDIIGEAVTAYDNSNAYLGVGNSSTAFNATQTDLLGASKYREGMEATYPQRSGDILTFRALYGTGVANFAWQEWGTFNASTAGTMLQRYVESLGTKTSAQSWQLTVDITVNNP